MAHRISTANAEEAQNFISAHLAPVKLQLGPGVQQLRFDATALRSSEFQLLDSSVSAGVSLIPQAAPDTVIVRLGMSGVMRAEGARLTEHAGPNELLLYAARSGKRLIFDSDHHDLTLVLPGEEVRHRVQDLTGQAMALPLDFIIRLDDGKPVAAALFCLGTAIRAGLSGSAPLLHSPIGLRRYRDALVGLMLAAIGMDRIASLAGPVASLAAIDVARAEDYMRLNAGNAIGVSDVAEALGISMRSLQYGFRKHRQTHPLAVLQRMRLEGLREDILANPSRSIADVAPRWGFTHLGRLSKQYQEAFGERPSVTARRARG